MSETVSIREVYEIVQKLRDEIKERDRELLERFGHYIADRDRANEALSAKFDALSARMESLTKEIYGEGDSKGIRGRVGDLEKNSTIAHGVQAAFTAIAAVIAGWLGSRP